MSITVDAFTNRVQLQREIAEAEARLAQLKQAATIRSFDAFENDPEQDWLNGGDEIAAFLGWTVRKVYHAHRAGKFKGAVVKMGRRSMLGSKQKLRALIETLAAESSNT
jgi:hypothetical protein